MKKPWTHKNTRDLEWVVGGVDKRNTEWSSVGMDVIQAQILRENLQNVIY